MPLVSQTFDQLLDFTRATSGTFVGSNGLVQTTPASVNLFTFTQQFDNAAWTKTAATVTANTNVAPDGTSTADTITEDTTAASTHRVFRSFGVAVTPHTASVYLKAGTRSWGYIRLTDSGGVERFAYFNLSTGALGTVQTNLTASITDAGNGWYRCTATVSASFSTGTTVFGIADADGGAIYTGNGTGNLFIWGAQLEAVPAANLVLGSEIVTNGTFAGASTTGWTAGGSATLSGTGDVLTITNGATAFGHAVTPITTIVGRRYYVTYQVTGGTNNGALYIGTSSGGFEIYNGPGVGVGSYAVSFVATTTTTYLRLGPLVNTSGATFIVDNISTKEITAITGMPSTYTRNNGGRFPPRFDYDPVTLAAKGLLIEEQRTNLATYSEQFDNAAWFKTATATVTANTSTAPDGTTTADTLNMPASGDRINLSAIAITGGTTYTASIWLSGSGTTFISLASSGGTFIFAAQQITLTATPTRYTVSLVTNANNTGVFPIIGRYNGVVGDGTATSAVIWGYQLEAGAFATSYIPTVASQVTRTADQCSIVAPNFAPWYNQSEGTFVGSFGSAPVNNIAQQALYVSDGTGNNAIVMRRNTTGFLATAVVAGGVTQGDIASGNAIAGGAIYNFAFAYATNDLAESVNGAAVATDTSASIPTVNQINLGLSVAGIQSLNGHIRSIRYYPTRLTNAQLQALTA